ncbi:MAG TPA: M36 family metallopeptidase [Candidatus Limnocylindria bacterium]
MSRTRRMRPLIVGVAIASLVAAPSVLGRQPANGGSTAEGLVFNPNPVVTSGIGDLADAKDADYDLLNDERVSVTLTHLDGSGYLHGDYAFVVSSTGDPAFETDGTFDYTRHDDRFEQVMAYYWVTQAQLYIRSLGFGNDLAYPGINDDAQMVRINQLGYDNSFATDHPKDEMRFGKGGVDDAEDGEVILHEYGHQIHFSQSATFFSSLEAGSISEGFGDYWAATVAEWAGPAQSDPACIAEWDSVSYTAGPVHCLRRLDTSLMYPTDLNGRVHHDGQIWSHALWNLRTALGAQHADWAILNAQFGWTGTTMPDLAARIVAQVEARYGAGEAAQAEAAFAERGILP